MSVINRMLVDLEARRAADRPAMKARQTACVGGPQRRVRRLPQALLWALTALAITVAGYAGYRGGRGEIEPLLERTITSAVAATHEESASAPQSLAPATDQMVVAIAADAARDHAPESHPAMNVVSVRQPGDRFDHPPAVEAPAVQAAISPRQAKVTSPQLPAEPVDRKVPPARPAQSQPEAGTTAQPPATKRPEPIKPATVALPQPRTRAAAEVNKVPRKPSPQEQFANYLNQARHALAKGHTSRAKTLVHQAMRLAPDNAAATELLLAVQLRAGDAEGAMATLRRVLARDPANARYAQVYARLLAARGDHESAVRQLRASLDAGSNDGQSLALLAGLERRIGNHESAAEHYLQALAQDGGVAVWWLGLGMSLEQLRQPAEARAAFAEAKRIGGLDGEVTVFLEQRLAELDVR